MARRSTSTYPPDWREIATRVKDEAGWRCVRCQHPHDRQSGRVLTVHHLDLSPANCRWWNLAPLCQVCHLQIQAKVVMARPWVMTDHTAWFKPYAAGFYAWKYLNEELSREEVEARMDELLRVERRMVLGIGFQT